MKNFKFKKCLILKSRMISSKGFKQSSFSILAMLFSGISILVLTKLIISQNGLEGLGIFSLALSLTVFLKMFDITGSVYCARFIAEADLNTEDTINKKAIIIDTSMSVALIFYLVTGFVGISIAPILINIFYEIQLATKLVEIISFMILLLALNSVMETQNGSLDGLHKTVPRSIIGIMGCILCVGLAFYFVPKYGVLGAVFSQIAQACFSILACRIFLSMNVDDIRIFPKHFSFIDFKAMFKFGRTIHISTLSGFGFDPLIKILIVNYGGPILLAYYDLSLKTVGLARSAFGAAFIPIYNNFSAFKSNNIAQNYKYFDEIVVLNSFQVALMFSLLSFFTPLVSIIFLEKIDLHFLSISLGVLIGYVGNTLFIPMYMYAQSKKRLFWNNIGQLTIAFVTIIICIIIGFYEKTLVVYSIPFGLLAGSTVSYLGNRRNFVKEYSILENINLNEKRYVWSMMIPVISSITTLVFCYQLT